MFYYDFFIFELVDELDNFHSRIVDRFDLHAFKVPYWFRLPAYVKARRLKGGRSIFVFYVLGKVCRAAIKKPGYFSNNAFKSIKRWRANAYTAKNKYYQSFLDYEFTNYMEHNLLTPKTDDNYSVYEQCVIADSHLSLVFDDQLYYLTTLVDHQPPRGRYCRDDIAPILNEETTNTNIHYYLDSEADERCSGFASVNKFFF